MKQRFHTAWLIGNHSAELAAMEDLTFIAGRAGGAERRIGTGRPNRSVKLPCDCGGPMHDLSLAGHFLVASRYLRDPNFVKSVVLMIQHDDEGAVGVVINRPADKTVREVWDAIGYDAVRSGRPHLCRRPGAGAARGSPHARAVFRAGGALGRARRHAPRRDRRDRPQEGRRAAAL